MTVYSCQECQQELITRCDCRHILFYGTEPPDFPGNGPQANLFDCEKHKGILIPLEPEKVGLRFWMRYGGFQKTGEGENMSFEDFIAYQQTLGRE